MVVWSTPDSTGMDEREGGSHFIILYHRTPFDEARDASGERKFGETRKVPMALFRH